MNGIPPSVSAARIQPELSQAIGVEKKDSTNLFKNLVEAANKDQLNADNSIQNLVEQKPGANVQQVVVAVTKAEMSFQFLMEVRNQLIDSYNELMRMQF